VAGSRWARVIATTCKAWLSWRSPPRFRRCCVRYPEAHGIGAVPVCSPKLANHFDSDRRLGAGVARLNPKATFTRNQGPSARDPRKYHACQARFRAFLTSIVH
jgi:hypothetical protein